MEPQPATSDPTALRDALVKRLKDAGCITTATVEAAFRAVPRHLFLPQTPVERVYQDEAIVTKTADGLPVSSSSQPAIMAVMLEQLDVRPGQRILEIGAGTGYNAALLAHLVGATGEIVTVDIDEGIVAAARGHLAAAGLERVQVIQRDGALGYPPAAPYDRIILTVGAWDITPSWRDQLRPGGRLVLPLAIGGVQKCIAFECEAGGLVSRSVEDCGFMRLRGPFAGPEGYVPLGPAPGLVLMAANRARIDADALYALLTGLHHDAPSGIRLTLPEFSSLTLWLAAREPDSSVLSASSEAANRLDVPWLTRWPSGASTIVLPAAGALAALTRPPNAAAADPESPDSAPIELWVRTFRAERGASKIPAEPGRNAEQDGDSAAPRLLDAVAAWDRAGRPAAGDARIRAVPIEREYAAAPGETVLPKRWNRLVIG